MSLSQTITVIIGCLSGIVGILLIMWGTKLFSRPINLRIQLGFVLAAIGLFIITTEVNKYSSGFTVLATLALAFAAFMAIRQTRDFEKTRSTQSKITDVNKWATDISVAILDFSSTPQKADTVMKTIDTDSIASEYIFNRRDMAESLVRFRMESEYIRALITNDPELLPLTENVITNLRLKLKLSFKYFEYLDKLRKKNGLLKASRNLANNEFILYNSIVTLLQTTGNIKSLI